MELAIFRLLFISFLQFWLLQHSFFPLFHTAPFLLCVSLSSVFIVPSYAFYLSLYLFSCPPSLILVFMSYFFNFIFPSFILSTFRSRFIYIFFLLPPAKALEHASDQHVHLVSRLQVSVFLPPLCLCGMMFMPVKVLSELISKIALNKSLVQLVPARYLSIIHTTELIWDFRFEHSSHPGGICSSHSSL